MPAVEEVKKPRIVKTKESLRHDFTDAETLDLSRDLARSHQELALIEEGKEKVVADFKAQIQAKENVISDLSRRINNGYEYRSIECELRFHEPEKGMKTLVRLDNAAVVKTTRMDSWEAQEHLFEDDVLESVAEQINNGALDSNGTTVRAKVKKSR